jgi:hypothetical protein
VPNGQPFPKANDVLNALDFSKNITPGVRKEKTKNKNPNGVYTEHNTLGKAWQMLLYISQPRINAAILHEFYTSLQRWDLGYH